MPKHNNHKWAKHEHKHKHKHKHEHKKKHLANKHKHKDKHLANNHKWAEHGAKTENATTEPDVEEQQELWGKKNEEWWKDSP